MRYTITLSDEAQEDYDNIFERIKEYDEQTAESFTADLLKRIGLLADTPLIGKETSDEKSRRIVKKPYLIYYEVDQAEREITVLYIKHEAQNTKR